jgi:hypothetical protein
VRLYTMSKTETQKSQNKGDRVHPTKVGDKQRERERDEGTCATGHRYTSLSLYRLEPLRSPMLTIATTAWYHEFARGVRPTCWKV